MAPQRSPLPALLLAALLAFTSAAGLASSHPTSQQQEQHALTAAPSAAATLTVSVTIPFGPRGVPTPATTPALADLKLTLKAAFQDALTHVAGAHFSGPEGASLAPPLSGAAAWTLDLSSDPQTATVVFEYPAAWSVQLYYLVMQPEDLYSSGPLLMQRFGAVDGASVSLSSPASAAAAAAAASWISPPFDAPLPAPEPRQHYLVEVEASALSSSTTSSGRSSPAAHAAARLRRSLEESMYVEYGFGAPPPGSYGSYAPPPSSYGGYAPPSGGYGGYAPPSGGYGGYGPPSGYGGYAPPGYGGYGASSRPGHRRLVERLHPTGAVPAPRSSPTAAQWAAAEPSDVAYGTDQALFEVFTFPLDYYAAGAACAARGASLASYATEGSQIFVDILCDASLNGQASRSCWVDGNSAGACSLVRSSRLLHQSCAQRMPFVCVKDASPAAQPPLTTAQSSPEVPTPPLPEVQWASALPADAAMSLDGTTYEVFDLAVPYHAAGSACLAHGATLADYRTEAAQVFIDVLCDAVAGGKPCWIEGSGAGTCTSLSASTQHQSPCSAHHAFVCAKAPMPSRGH